MNRGKNCLEYVALLPAAFAACLLVLLFFALGIYFFYPSWDDFITASAGLCWRQFALASGRLLVLSTILLLVLSHKGKTAAGVSLLTILTIPLFAKGILLSTWQALGEFAALGLLPTLRKKGFFRPLVLVLALTLCLVFSYFTEAPLLLPPEAGEQPDTFSPLPQGGWLAVVAALLATAAGNLEKLNTGSGWFKQLNQSSRRLLWSATFLLTLPVLWQPVVTLERVREGQEIFDSADCSDCHRYQTGNPALTEKLPILPGTRQLVDLTLTHAKFSRANLWHYLATTPMPGKKWHRPPFAEAFTEIERQRLSDFLLYLRALPSESGVDAE